MKKALSIGLFGLIVAAAVVWIVGVVGGVVVPLFGGVRAERIGAVLLIAGACGEVTIYLIGLAFTQRRMTKLTAPGALQLSKGFGAEKRYGNRKSPIAHEQHTPQPGAGNAMEAKP